MYANLERWPATPSEGDNERAERAPRIVLMGSRRSGKTSMAAAFLLACLLASVLQAASFV